MSVLLSNLTLGTHLALSALLYAAQISAVGIVSLVCVRMLRKVWDMDMYISASKEDAQKRIPLKWGARIVFADNSRIIVKFCSVVFLVWMAALEPTTNAVDGKPPGGFFSVAGFSEQALWNCRTPLVGRIVPLW